MVIYFCLVFFVTSFLAFGLSRLNITSTYDSELLSAYECGFNPFSDTRSGFDVKFYLIAIFFIIFDLEIVILFPLVVYVTNLNIFQFSIMLFFLFQLALGLIYEYFSGSLDWSHELLFFTILCCLILFL
jgi:NADH:ubiquinone oxidoreductase subunit 3 (subunit A)